MNRASTCYSADDLTRYWQGELPADQSECVEQHLAECSACLEQLRLLEKRDPFCQKVESACAGSVSLPDFDMAKINECLAEIGSRGTPLDGTSSVKTDVPGNPADSILPPQLPSIPGYEVLGHLGEGAWALFTRPVKSASNALSP